MTVTSFDIHVSHASHSHDNPTCGQISEPCHSLQYAIQKSNKSDAVLLDRDSEFDVYSMIFIKHDLTISSYCSSGWCTNNRSIINAVLKVDHSIFEIVKSTVFLRLIKMRNLKHQILHLDCYGQSGIIFLQCEFNQKVMVNPQGDPHLAVYLENNKFNVSSPLSIDFQQSGTMTLINCDTEMTKTHIQTKSAKYLNVTTLVKYSYFSSHSILELRMSGHLGIVNSKFGNLMIKDNGPLNTVIKNSLFVRNGIDIMSHQKSSISIYSCICRNVSRWSISGLKQLNIGLQNNLFYHSSVKINYFDRSTLIFIAENLFHKSNLTIDRDSIKSQTTSESTSMNQLYSKGRIFSDCSEKNDQAEPNSYAMGTIVVQSSTFSGSVYVQADNITVDNATLRDFTPTANHPLPNCHRFVNVCQIHKLCVHQ